MKSKTRKGTSWCFFGKAEGSTERKSCPSYQWLEAPHCLSQHFSGGHALSHRWPEPEARANHLSLFLPHRLCAGLDTALSTHRMAICMVLCKELYCSRLAFGIYGLLDHTTSSRPVLTAANQSIM